MFFILIGFISGLAIYICQIAFYVEKINLFVLGGITCIYIILFIIYTILICRKNKRITH